MVVVSFVTRVEVEAICLHLSVAGFLFVARVKDRHGMFIQPNGAR